MEENVKVFIRIRADAQPVDSVDQRHIFRSSLSSNSSHLKRCLVDEEETKHMQIGKNVTIKNSNSYTAEKKTFAFEKVYRPQQQHTANISSSPTYTYTTTRLSTQQQVFPVDIGQDEVYGHVSENLMRAIEGYNSTIMVQLYSVYSAISFAIIVLL
jgi:hypothetical protein